MTHLVHTGLGLFQVLEDFPHASKNITLEYLFDLISPLKPRAFSIASSLKVCDLDESKTDNQDYENETRHILNFQAHPNNVQILMAVVKYKTNLYKPRAGVCSTWLASLDKQVKNIKIPVWIKKATISFPKSLETPVIMIGPGEIFLLYSPQV
jgi:sulfite reductase alpha subunit-like flavoprotein